MGKTFFMKAVSKVIQTTPETGNRLARFRHNPVFGKHSGHFCSCLALVAGKNYFLLTAIPRNRPNLAAKINLSYATPFLHFEFFGFAVFRFLRLSPFSLFPFLPTTNNQ